MTHFVRLCFLAPSLVAAAAGAQTARPARSRADPSIEQVVSGGRWTANAANGGYRTVVVREGSEEIRRRVTLEWIQDGGPRTPESLRQSLELNERTDAYALSDPAFVKRGSRWFLRLRAAAAPLAPYDRIVEFELGPPGSVTRIQRP